MVYIGTERYLNRLWKLRYGSGYFMHILRRWSDGMLSVRFEKV